MKLTESIIDQLIAEQIEKLNEKITTPKVDVKTNNKFIKAYQKDGEEYNKDKGIQVKIKQLASNDNRDSEITVADLETAFSDKEQSELDAISYLSKGLSGASGTKKTKTQFYKDKQDAAKSVADKQTVDMGVGTSKINVRQIQQTIQNYDLANASMQSTDPTLPPSLKNLFDVVALSGNTLDQRITKISEFSQNVLKAANDEDAAKNTLKAMGLLKFMQFCLVIDYLSAITKAMDSGSGAYLFETFLAALAGGSVAGKEQTSAGKSGGADFTFGTGVNARGSSKFVKNAKKADQATKGFEKQETVHYVIAQKILDKGMAPDAKPSSQDPSQIIGFSIYYPILHVIEPKRIFRFLDTDRQQIGDIIFHDPNKSASDRIEFKSVLQRTKLPDLQIISANGEIFRDLINKAVDNIAGGVNTAFDKFQGAFDKVNSAKEFVGSYAASGKQKDGQKAITELIAYKKALKEVFAELKGQNYASSTGADTAATGYEDPGDKEVAKLNENNLENILDKLIQEVILTK